MEWLKSCAREVAKTGGPIFWVVPSGFVVRQFYAKQSRRNVHTKVDGQKVQLQAWVPTNVASLKDQMSGVAPNFVHSLDGSMLATLIDRVQAEGITSLSPIHDNLGALAADMDALQRIIREEFVALYTEQDPLEEFRKWCRTLLVPYLIVEEKMAPAAAHEEAERRLPPVPKKGTLNLEGVLESDYFFS